MRAFLSRWVCDDVASNLVRLELECQRAHDAGAELVVFPELFLSGYRGRLEPRAARERFAAMSRGTPGKVFVFGSISEGDSNRVTVWSDGLEIAAYDKVHLFAPNGETEMWSPGDRYVGFQWRGTTIGLMNCNDVRFPEQARALSRQARCTMFVVPAWWPWRRDHVWRTLLRARAIENASWVLGCSIAASITPGDELAGAGNHVFDPAGDPVRTADDSCYDLDLANPPAAPVDPVADAVDITRIDVM